MIQPINAQEARYTFNLAALWIRAHSQHAAGDTPGSNALMTSWRSLKLLGDDVFKERNGGLIEYADVLAQETPRSDRLTNFMVAQDDRLGVHPLTSEGASTVISPETDSEREYVEQLTNLLLTAEGLRRGGNEEQADAYLAPVPVWKSLGHQLYGDRAAGLVEVAYAAAREREAMAIILADKEEFPPTLPHLDKLLSVEPTTTTTTPVPATTTTTTTTSAPKKVDKVVKKEAKKTATTTTTPGFSVETGTFRSAATTTTAAPSDTVTFKSPATVTVQSAPTTTTTPPPFRSTASRLTHDRGV